MPNKLHQIFKKDQNISIGSLHFPTLTEYKDSPGLEIAKDLALKDLKVFEQGGIDAIIFENNYDNPHKEFVSNQTREDLYKLGKSLKQNTSLPMGISVLWNDYKTALIIAKQLHLDFIRVPVFVDTVETNDCGIIKGNPSEIIKFRSELQANQVAIFTDIHVKHSKVLTENTILQAADLAIQSGSDGIIITGNWTGSAPDAHQLKSIREYINKDFPILIGSGANKKNIKSLFEYANAAIVSTSLKEGSINKNEVNMKKYEQRVSLEKVIEFVKAYD